MSLRRAVAVSLAFACSSHASRAAADGLDLDVWGARDIARAGATMVSEDGGAALWLNPAGLVRREQTRAQVGIALHEDSMIYRAANAAALGAPDIKDRAPVVAAPSVALQTRLGPLMVGLAYVERGDLHRVFSSPGFNQPAADVERLFPHRYAGTELRYQRRSVSAGAAIRANSWLGIGVSVSIDQLSLAETRYLWAGFAGRDGLAHPSRDLRLHLSGVDNFVPGATIGLLIAPPDLPLEMAVSASYSADASLGANASLTRTRNTDFPAPELIAPRATALLSTPLRLRAGLRYLGEHLFVEASGEIGAYVADHASPEWHLHGVWVRDQTASIAELATVPSLIDRRAYAIARASTDVQVIAGFLWVTAGYAYRTAGSRHDSATAVFADFGGHILAVGAEGHFTNMTLSIGYARFVQPPRTVQTSVVALPNPFDGGSLAIGNGRYERSRDAFGAALEISWE